MAKNSPLSMPSVTINEMIEMVYETYMIAYNNPNGKYLPLHFSGMPGLGKTAGFVQAAMRIADKLNRQFVHQPTTEDYRAENIPNSFFANDIRISQMSSLDVRGLVARSSSDPNRMTWLAPEWLASHPDITGMNFFDEIQLGRPEVQAAAYQIINERMVGNIRLSRNVMQIAASNPVAAGGLNYGIPPALANRFMHISVSEDVESYNEWAAGHGINPIVRAYLRWQQNDLLVFPDNPDMLSYPTPRTWEMVSHAMNIKKEDIRNKLINAAIGAEHSAKFIAYMDEALQLPDPKEILVNGNMVYPDRRDLVYAMLESVLSAVENDNKQVENFIKWTTGKQISADLQAYGFKMALNADKHWLVRNKTFIAMMQTNPRLRDLIVKAR